MPPKTSVALLFTAITLACASCTSAPAEKNNDQASSSAVPDKPTEKISVVLVHKQELRETADLPVSIEGYDQARLMAKIDAYVKRVLVDIGDEVSAGDALVELEAVELDHEVHRKAMLVAQCEAAQALSEAELRAAESKLDEQQAVLDLRESERERMHRLASQGAMSDQKREEAELGVKSAEASQARFQSEVEVAEAKVHMAQARRDVAQAELEQAEVLASYQTIRAPFDGVISMRNIDPGDFVQPVSGGDSVPLMEMANIDKLRAVIYVSMNVAGCLGVGDLVELTTIDAPGVVFKGEVSRQSGVFDENTRMMRAEIDLDNRPDPQTGRRPLHAGSYGTATVVLSAAQLPSLPKTALRQVGKETFVMVVAQDGTCTETRVEVAFENGDLVGIRKGIHEGDRVVADQPGRLKDKQRLACAEITELKSY